jgi:hypothetical protein
MKILRKKCVFVEKLEKYSEDYIKIGFFWTGDEECPNPLCVLYLQIMTNESMKPAKLFRHLETKRKDAIGKPIEFFQRKLKEITASRSVMEYSATGEHAKVTEASFQVLMTQLNAAMIALDVDSYAPEPAFFALQVDESTDITNDACLLCFVRYEVELGIHEKFLFCKTLPTHCTGQAIFDVLNGYK